jgi:amidase
MRDSLGAFVPNGLFTLKESGTGPLAGLTFAVKDLYDVEGHVTTAGNPVLGEERGPVAKHAATVAQLLKAGAELVGKTTTDEFAFGINGMNHHFGVPTNPEAPGRVTGGSSGGSASAVAGGVCDFALGTDTGGSVRIPASYCGLFGIRPTHGRVSAEGIWPLAKSLDTCGWFARDASLLARVGAILLDREAGAAMTPRRLFIAEDAFELLAPETQALLEPQIKRLADWIGASEVIRLAGPAGDLETMRDVYRRVQGREAWAELGGWISEHWETLGPDVAERFRLASKVTEAEFKEASDLREAHAAWLEERLAGEAFVCLPSALGPAPLVSQPLDTLDDWRLKSLRISAVSPLSRTPQISLPLARQAGAPVGMGLLGPKGADESLLAFAGRFTQEAEPGSQLGSF